MLQNITDVMTWSTVALW